MVFLIAPTTNPTTTFTTPSSAMRSMATSWNTLLRTAGLAASSGGSAASRSSTSGRFASQSVPWLAQDQGVFRQG